MLLSTQPPQLQHDRTRRPSEDESYTSLLEKIEPLRTALLSHPVYTQVDALGSLQVFMQSHIFAVWDFMTLIKTLQRRLTCIDTPWLPPSDINSARLVNDIVLAEETDEVAEGLYISHFDLYLMAMEEVGAERQPIEDFIASLRQGLTPAQSLAMLPIPLPTKRFVWHTLNTAHGSTHEVAAAFLLGREDIIPTMFRRLLSRLEQVQGSSCNAFHLYLDRHTHLDEEVHAPMGRRLLMGLCGQDPIKWQQASSAARQALQARYRLWDGIVQAIDSK
ncbi:MAG: DUF3050 domain-containing protein [Microcystaceae cyanobacterium]